MSEEWRCEGCGAIWSEDEIHECRACGEMYCNDCLDDHECGAHNERD